MSKREQSWSHSLKPGNNDRLGHFPFVQPYEYNPKGKTTTATTTFEHLFLVFVREDVAAAAREREGLCREEEGGRGEDAFCLKTLDSSRPLLEEGGESHFYTNFRRSVCVCGQK